MQLLLFYGFDFLGLFLLDLIEVDRACAERMVLHVEVGKLRRKTLLLVPQVLVDNAFIALVLNTQQVLFKKAGYESGQVVLFLDRSGFLVLGREGPCAVVQLLQGCVHLLVPVRNHTGTRVV